MENQSNNSNSELINPENNYKFDNYGIVMADSIEDLLYDKYHFFRKRKKNELKDLEDNYSKLFQNESRKNSNKIQNKLENKSLEKKSIILSEREEEQEEKEDIKFREIEISHNISIQYEQKDNRNDNNEIPLNKNHITIEVKNNFENNDNKNKRDDENKITNKNDEEKNNNQNKNNDEKINKINLIEKNENNIDDNINEKNKIFDIINENDKKNILKMIRCKEFHIKNNYIIKEKNKNKAIKIILNINDKEKKEIEINPYDGDVIKNISIDTNSINKKSEIKNNSNNNNKKENNKKKGNEEKSLKKDFKEKESNNDVVLMEKNYNKKRKINMFLKSIHNKNKSPINIDKKDVKNIKKIHLISTLENNDKKNNKEKKQKYMNKNNIFHNVPISSQCFIIKMRRNIILNKIIPKKERLFMTKMHAKRKKNIINKIILVPNSAKCYFKKEKKIINVKSHIPLQNVINKYYFASKQLKLDNEKLKKKVYFRKISNKTKTNEEEEDNDSSDMSNDQDNKNNNLNDESNEQDNIKNNKNDMNKKRKLDKTNTELIIENFHNSPNIIIKIINPPKSAYKYGKIDIKTNPSNNKIGKSNSCQRILFSNFEKEKIIPFNINNNKKKFKKIKKIKKFEHKKESTDYQILKNKEIVNALNSSYRFKSNCPEYFSLNRRKKFAEKLYRNIKLKNKHFSKSQKNPKFNILRPLFSANSLNIKNKIFNSKNDEEKIEKNIIKQFDDKDSKTNIVIFDKRNNNLKYKNKFSNNSINKYSNFYRIEFPAIDSYFH